METKANYVLIGAFTLAGFLGMLLFLMWFAKLQFNRQFSYFDVFFTDVSGLSVSSDVQFAGLSVGKVVDMGLSDQRDGTVRVRLEVREDTPVRTDSVASLSPQGVTGVFSVSISPGTPAAELLTKAGPDGVPVINVGRSTLQTLSDRGPEMIERLSTVAEQLTELLGEENQTRVRNILDNVERSSGNIDRAIADVTKATGAIAETAESIAGFGTQIQGLSDAAKTTLANADQALDQFSQTAKTADETLAEATQAMSTIRGYVTDDLGPLTTRLRGSMDGLDGILDTGRTTLVSVQKTFDGVNSTISTQVGPLVTDTRTALTSFSSSIGRVADDLPKITERLGNAADSADSAFVSMRQMMDSARGPVQAFARDTLTQIARLVSELRNVTQSTDQFISSMRRNPSQVITGSRPPEFRR